ncbi:unnamed protein product [Parascedosporium putredinis]|uniref:NADPH--hemoprotein reductase n=1 Tax=Parascedosporium putredinis TaxID=1442378 RepID=A0A9P1MF42_9PEZI|nr:unnamed protein product [Parascedosporium putredinis]CAI8004209.1 unnamed protein product [Parascedosporium putredinis]
MSERSCPRPPGRELVLEDVLSQDITKPETFTLRLISPEVLHHASKNVDSLTVDDRDLLAVALGAPARQVMIRAEEIGHRTGWKDGYLSAEMPGCVGRGRVRESIAAMPLVEGTEDIIPDRALWAAIVALGMLCSIYRYEEKNDGYDGVSINKVSTRPQVEMADDLGPELIGIPRATYNLKVRDPTSTVPYVGRFDNTDLRWPMFGERTEIAFLKGCADTDASFQHGPDAIAACQEAVMTRNVEGLLREMVRLKEILERMPNAFHSISTNPNSGDNYVSAMEWVRWGKFSAPLSKRCPAASGLQFSPTSSWMPSSAAKVRLLPRQRGSPPPRLAAFQPEGLYRCHRVPLSHSRVRRRVGRPRLMGVLDGIIEAYTGERGFMGTHRYKVFGILEVASKTGRTETNGNSGAAEQAGRPWEEVHRQFSDAMKERLEPFRGTNLVDPNEMRGTFAECRYKSRILNRQFVDSDPQRGLAQVTLDLHDTGVTFQPGDRLAVMPLNSWEECAKVAAALGLENMLDSRISMDRKWSRFAEHLDSVNHGINLNGKRTGAIRQLTVKDILRRGHLAPLTKDLVLKIHAMLRASSNTILQVLATTEWPVRGTLGDLLQSAVQDTPPSIWDRAFDLTTDLFWLSDLIQVEYNLCSTFSHGHEIKRTGVGSGFLNPPVNSPENSLNGDEEVLVGVSRPLTFQLPLDGAAPCAFFAGGSGIAPFRSFWQARIGQTVGRNILYLGVQNREKFCYEDELRQYVAGGYMEVHLAFSRDSRGLAYDPAHRDLVEKKMEPRYIDALIAEQGATVCDLVMSKKQGGLGGYLYICGSVAVFDSVMTGIRKAIYNHRTATMDNTDFIINSAFAERRIMLDVFMTPKPLPCNLATIPLSQLAVHTGHRPGSRIWLSVHGSVYDVTDFCPMHPGGTLIIKSNAGVDCSKSFDALAHTNNPEVASLLTKYFVGHLTPKPDYHGCEELSGLYDMWSDYLRTTVETLVAQQFEMDDLMGSDKLWYQGTMINMLGVRIFYQYQSRLLQGGFSALFGPKFQELVLKLSFTVANSSGAAGTKLPDILGAIARAKTSPDAVATSKEIALVGQFICDSESARFQERGIMDYAGKSVQLDIELLEDIREEACHGMDAFDTVMNLEVSSDEQRTTALCSFLMQILERMAKRLEPHHGAKPSYKPAEKTVEFDNVLFQIQQTIKDAPRQALTGRAHVPLNERHTLRTQKPTHGTSAMESHENSVALNRMSQFIDRNMKAMRRLSKMPPMPLNFSQMAATMEAQNLANQQHRVPGVTTPPSSRGSSRSPSRSGPLSSGMPVQMPSVLEEMVGQRMPSLHRRNTGSSDGGSGGHLGYSLSSRMMMPPSPATTPPLDSGSAIQVMVNKLNLRSRGATSPALSPVPGGASGGEHMHSRNASISSYQAARRSRALSSTGSLRTFKLVANHSPTEMRVPPTF